MNIPTIKNAIFNVQYIKNKPNIKFLKLDQYTKCNFNIDLSFNNSEYYLTHDNKKYLSINRSYKVGLKSDNIIHSTMLYHISNKSVKEYGRYAIHQDDLNNYMFELTFYDQHMNINKSMVGYLKFI